MKVTLNWLKEFLNTDQLEAGEIAQLLTMSGSEVKKIDYMGRKFEKIIIGQIVQCSPHPNADKLSLCQVDTGEELFSIVCGAKNFKVKDKVALALPGAKIGDFTLKRSKIRGQVSEGMMCSEAELGLSEDSEGIMILDQDQKMGQGFAEAMGMDDVAIELEITPNRPDCLSVIGIAREIAALKGLKLKLPAYQPQLAQDKDFELKIQDYSLCSRYSARIFYDIPRIPSPQWLVNRLALCDVRAVDLVVDLTNYVMLETGQPLHAFDKDLLATDKIIVRPAKAGESIRTIDDSQRQLEEGMIVIADAKGPVAIAGIMGGKETEINEKTKTVLLESANFNGPDIMRTSKKLGLRSEASNRFEKKIDPQLTLFAIERFSQLLADIAGQVKSSGIYDNYSQSPVTRELVLRPSQVTRILGAEISTEKIMEILGSLGLNCQPVREGIAVTVPSFRYQDLEREIDLIEEVARIYGFNNFTSQPPRVKQRLGGLSCRQQSLRDIKNCLADLGLRQVINYSFISGKKLQQYRLDVSGQDLVKIINPINEDFQYLRPSLFPGLMGNIMQNLKYRIEDMALFEISKVFTQRKDSKLPEERNILGVVLSGRQQDKGWNQQERAYDFYDLKGILEYLAERYFNSSIIEIKGKEIGFFHPVLGGTWSLEGQDMGMLGQVHPGLLAELEIEQPVYYLEIDLDLFLAKSPKARQFEPVTLYPAVDIDIAIVVDQSVTHQELRQAIEESGSGILQQVRLFDLYQGKQVEAGKKSMAYSLTFKRKDRTLKDTEVEVEVERILSCLAKKFNATLRQ